MIEVQKLTRYYGETLAIEDVSFQVGKGEIVGLLGPNGAGKTTTMRIITGYMPPTSGTAKINGYDVLEEPQEVKRRLGYLPENPPLYPDLRVSEYLAFVARLKEIPSGEIERAIDQVIEKAALQEVRHKVIGALSKGYRQRVGLAQALLNDPPVLILDEPTVGLDPRQIIEIRELIKALAGEHTVVLSTHILPEVEMTCQRVVIINDGRVVAEDTPENLTTRASGNLRIMLEIQGDGSRATQLIKQMPGVQMVQEQSPEVNGHLKLLVECERDLRSEIARTIVENGFSLFELTAEKYSLEDIFLKLTTQEEVLEE
ncbi:MAG: ATP-binding cassette domain-containing protein [Calditrichaeota bacterium]|nr:MAG: ATP-binding cassette domain-containing protein [Calditrichota bacterium]